MRVCLSISAQLFCKIKLVYFWVKLDFRTTCVIVVKISWTSVFQYITTNHAPGHIAETINFPKPGFIGPNKE